MDLEHCILCSTMIMTELDSSTFFHAQSRKLPKSGVLQVVHESGP